MGVAAAYIGEMVTEELKACGGGAGDGEGGLLGSAEVGTRPAGDDLATKIVVVAPQEGQVAFWWWPWCWCL